MMQPDVGMEKSSFTASSSIATVTETTAAAAAPQTATASASAVTTIANGSSPGRVPAAATRSSKTITTQTKKAKARGSSVNSASQPSLPSPSSLTSLDVNRLVKDSRIMKQSLKSLFKEVLALQFNITRGSINVKDERDGVSKKKPISKCSVLELSDHLNSLLLSQKKKD